MATLSTCFEEIIFAGGIGGRQLTRIAYLMLGSRQAKPSNTTSHIARLASCGLRSSAWSHKAEIEAQIEHFCGDIKTLKTNYNREMLSFRYASLANYSERTSPHSCG